MRLFCIAAVLAMTACAHGRPAPPASGALAPPANTGLVEGRVLWNEEPIAGAHVYATSEYNFSSAHHGDATTDRQGRFLISSVPAGQKYLYVMAPGRPFWVSAVTPFVSVAGQKTSAPDTYVCKGFDPIAPLRGESLASDRPELRWEPYPDAVDYAVRVLRTGQNAFAFSRGDSDSHLAGTSVRVEPALSAGEYTWRVDAFNRQGHIIGCSYFPRVFTIAGRQTPPAAVAGNVGTLDSRVDPDRAIYGVPLGTSIAEFVGVHGRPTGELHLSPADTVLVYGRSHAFYFENERLVGGFLRAGGYVLDFRLTERLAGTTRFDALGWQLSNGVESGMTLTTIRKMLGDKLLGCSAGGPGFPRCYFTTDRSRVEFDFVPRASAGVSGDDTMVAMGIIVRAKQ
jgi:hypothetical protein